MESSISISLSDGGRRHQFPSDTPSSEAGWIPSRSSISPMIPVPNDIPRAIDPSNLPGGKRSLSGISLRSFLLGLVLGVSTSLTIFLWWSSNSLWRASFFLASLSLFHFLEFYVTACYNPRKASISAFLLTQNGAAYNIAHGSAMTECILARILLPPGYFKWTAIIFAGSRWQVGLGLALMVVGQIARTLAMVQAGTNFSHTMQRERKDGHILVKDGIYSILRHPSYFGFFWWGLGTQVVLGNVFCFLGYALVLWKFFSTRIQSKPDSRD